MKKRLRRKFHRKWVDEVNHEISMSPKWRGLLFSLSIGYPLLIDKDTSKDLDYIHKDIEKYDLKYYVWTQRCNEHKLYFEFESVEFKKIHSYSINPINVHADFVNNNLSEISND